MQDLQKFIGQHGLTQASVARSIGVSGSVISQYMKGVYAKNGGDQKTLETRLNAYMQNYLHKRDNTQSVDIIRTHDLGMIEFTCEEVTINREMGAIYGKAGTGKTVAIKAFCDKHPEAMLIETIPMISVKGLLLKILEKLGQRDVRGSVEQLHAQAVATFKRADRILIIDEAENLTTKSLEAIRRIHDFSGLPVVLVGTHALLQNLKGRQGELLQIYSRIQNKWQMQGLTKDDRETLFGAFGKAISRYTDDVRRSVSMFNKATRFAKMANEQLAQRHIDMASTTVILD